VEGAVVAPVASALNLALFCNWGVVFCILTAVLRNVFERIDIEEDEDFGLHYTRS